jgi:Uma2 family endonuclease
MVVRKPLLTPADVERMMAHGKLDPDAILELVDGELVSLRPASLYHSRVCMAIVAALLPFARQIGAELLGQDAGFIVGVQHRQVRSPDVSLVTSERRYIAPAGGMLATEAPDLAVAVLSGEQHGEAYARAKIGEYFAAGAKLVWLVDPDARTVRVYEAGAHEYAIYLADSTITLEAIAPGFSAPVASFFP